jgi:hypothetical protein
MSENTSEKIEVGAESAPQETSQSDSAPVVADTVAPEVVAVQADPAPAAEPAPVEQVKVQPAPAAQKPPVVEGQIDKNEAAKPMTHQLEVGKEFPTKSPLDAPDVINVNGRVIEEQRAMREMDTFHHDGPKQETFMAKAYKGKIGPRWLRLEKGKVYSLPKNVRNVLKRAGYVGVY